MEIVKINKSRISKVNFSNLIFGEEFTDHMFTCDYVEGKWINPKIVPYEKLKMEHEIGNIKYVRAVLSPFVGNNFDPSFSLRQSHRSEDFYS